MPRQDERADTDPGSGPPADPESVARTILLNKLTAQPRTRAELAEMLARKLVPGDVAARVLDRFEEVGLIDDEAFARSWVESRQVGRGLARRALAQELRRKGVSDDVTRKALAEVDPDDEEAAARQLVRRKLRSMSRLDTAARLRRLTGMLARKGYPAGLAYRVVREELDEADLDDADGNQAVMEQADVEQADVEQADVEQADVDEAESDHAELGDTAGPPVD